jgi:hypothetical protein
MREGRIFVACPVNFNVSYWVYLSPGDPGYDHEPNNRIGLFEHEVEVLEASRR